MVKSRNIIMFIPLLTLKQLYSNVLFCLFCYELSWLYHYPFSSYSISIKSIMTIVIFKKFSSAKIKTFLATRISNQLLYSNSNLEYIWVYLSGLLLQLKREGTRARGERRHRQSFLGNCQTMIHMFNSPIYPLDEGNEDVGSVRNFIFFLFSLKQVHCFGLNSKAQGEYLICIVLDKIPELRESISPSNFYGQGPNS